MLKTCYKKNVAYAEYLLNLMPLDKSVMIERCGQKLTPQIYINDQHIGGLTELSALDNSGKLDKLIN